MFTGANESFPSLPDCIPGHEIEQPGGIAAEGRIAGEEGQVRIWRAVTG